MEADLTELESLQELYNHLIANAETYGYSERDVNELFGLLSQKEELNELHKNLMEIAEGDLLKVLKELDTEQKGIGSPVALISYLLDEAQNNDYTEEDAIKLLLEYLAQEDLGEIIKLLIGTASGDLLDLLLSLDTDQNNIRNLDDLYKYLLEQARYHEYTEEDVIRLFLNVLKIMEHEPIVEQLQMPVGYEEKEKAGKGWIFFTLTGIALIILVILFIRRRKPEKEDESA